MLRLWFALVIRREHRRAGVRPLAVRGRRRRSRRLSERAAHVTADYREFYRGRAVMITGGLGFIGSNLARQLVELGADVLLVDSLIPDYGGNLFNIDGIADRVRVNIADIRQQSTMNYLVRDRAVIFNLAGQVSHIDSMRDPYIGSRDQLPQPADAARGLPLQQPDGEGRVRRHAPGLRAARLAAGQREPSGAADRRQRHQQGGGRVLPPRLQQRLRRARLLAAADQRLRAASAAQAQPPGLHRLVHPAGDRGPARFRSTATAPSSATSSTSTMPRTRSCGRARATRATARCSTSAADQPISAPRADDAADRGRRHGTRRVRGVAAREEGDRHRQLLRRLDASSPARPAGRRPVGLREGLARTIAFYREHWAHYVDAPSRPA